MNKPWGLAAYGLIYDAVGQLLIIRRSADSKTNPGKWEPPGGKLELGERVDEALCREVKEETGLDIVVTGVAGAVEYNHPAVRVICLVMTTGALHGTVRLSNEHEAFMWADETALARADLTDHFRRFFRTRNDALLRSRADI